MGMGSGRRGMMIVSMTKSFFPSFMQERRVEEGRG